MTGAAFRQRGGRHGRRDGGQSLVELAIALPILLALIIGIFEFGRAWNVSQVLTNAAREGARVAVLATSDEDDVLAVIESYLADAALDPATAEITITGAEATTGEATNIAISYPFEFQFLGPVVDLLGDGGDVPGTVTLATTATMRHE